MRAQAFACALSVSPALVGNHMRVHAKPLAATDAIPLAHQPAQAATRLGIGKTTLYELIDAREIHTFKIGVRTLIPEAELQRFIQAKMKQASNDS